MPLYNPSGGGSSSGTVTSVTAADASVVASGTATVAPAIATGTLDVIATQHPPAAAVPMNSQKLTGLANGSAAADSVAYGQLGSAAFQATSAFDAAGAAAAAAATAEAASLPLAGGTMSGAIAMGSHKVTGLANGSGAQDAAAFGQIPAALPPNGSAGGSLTGTYPNPGLAAGTTSTAGALQLDGTATDIQATGPQAAGNSAKAAAANHVHFSSGMFLCAPNVYAPASVTSSSVNTTTMAAFSTGNICTGSFTAPASGKVLVVLYCVMDVSATGAKTGLGLAAAGTVTPLVASAQTPEIAGTTISAPVTTAFLVTGLTAGNSYQFDLLGCCTSGDTATITSQGQASTSLAVSTAGPTIMTVQAV